MLISEARSSRLGSMALVWTATLMIGISLAHSGLAHSGLAAADQASGATAPAADAPPPTGSFLSSLKQAFKQDFDKEVVRGHFDVGSPPDSHRYYCLVDPKTGKREANAVAGQPKVRKDGTTGITGGAVTFYTCAEAENKGNLVTDGYVLGTLGKGGTPAPVTSAAETTRPAAPPSADAGAAASAPNPKAAGAPQSAAEDGPTREIQGVFSRLIASLNAHDRIAVSEALIDSPDFVWARLSGASIWGRRESLDALQGEWQGTWSVEPQPGPPRISRPGPGVAVLITPMVLTHGAPGETPSTTRLRWGGVFVKSGVTWRVASIFDTPWLGAEPPH